MSRKPLTDEQKKNISVALEEARLGLRPPPTEKQRLKAFKAGLKGHYGLTVEDYIKMFEEQKGVCKICSKPETSISRFGTPKRMTVDHCHSTGRIRGLLCDNCNRGIGHLRDDISILEKAIEYLR